MKKTKEWSKSKTKLAAFLLALIALLQELVALLNTGTFSPELMTHANLVLAALALFGIRDALGK